MICYGALASAGPFHFRTHDPLAWPTKVQYLKPKTGELPSAMRGALRDLQRLAVACSAFRSAQAHEMTMGCANAPNHWLAMGTAIRRSPLLEDKPFGFPQGVSDVDSILKGLGISLAALELSAPSSSRRTRRLKPARRKRRVAIQNEPLESRGAGPVG
jgi:hypothetical protein